MLILFGAFFSCKEQEARRPVSVKTHVSLASTTKELKKLNELEDQVLANYMKLDSTSSYTNSQNGFWYTTLSKSNNNRFPKRGDIVQFSYEVRNLYDEIIYNKEDIGIQTYIIDKQDIIRGLQLGIKTMNEEDKVKFLIPAYNAYGIVGDQNKIGVNQSIIIIVTLQSIN